MGTMQDERNCADAHRKWAKECVARAQRAEDEGDKALWLTLAQSWVRLAEHVLRGQDGLPALSADGDAAVTMPSANHN